MTYFKEDSFTASYCVFILTDKARKKLEVGITSNLKEKLKRLEDQPEEDYCKYLVYYEFNHLDTYIVRRELKLSGYSLRKLMRFVKSNNPGMKFLNPFP